MRILGERGMRLKEERENEIVKSERVEAGFFPFAVSLKNQNHLFM